MVNDQHREAAEPLELIGALHGFPQTDTAWRRRRTLVFALSGCSAVFLASVAAAPMQFSLRPAITVLSLAACAVLLIATVALGRRTLRNEGRAVRSEAAGPQDRASARLICHGTTAEIAQLSDLMASSFEPITFRGGWLGFQHVRDGSPAPIVCSAVLVLAGMGIIYALWSTAMIAFTVAFVMCVVASVVHSMWPILYYRVSPGRLEILRGLASPSRARLLHAFDLSTSRVECRFDQSLVELVEGLGGTQRRFQIHLNHLETPHEFCRVLFRAAISARTAVQHPTRPPLA